MPLNVAFLWHMHQPLYRDPVEGLFRLPWVRLHATRNYLFFAREIEKYPGVRHTVNFSPCLVEQIIDLAENPRLDFYFRLSDDAPDGLSAEEKLFVIEKFFRQNEDTTIPHYPRYRELLEVKRRCGGDAAQLVKKFGDAEILDLVVLFNLSWVNPVHDEEFPVLRCLREKGRNYTKEDLKKLLNVHVDIMKQIVPTYRRLLEEGAIDITCSPYFHPILPLLIDSDCARQTGVEKEFPEFRISFPEDARWHVEAGRELFREIFGFDPAGMWPSEGAVSQGTISLLEKSGFEFAFSDELVLAKSLGLNLSRDGRGFPSGGKYLYKPWRFGECDVSVFFRDHYLSDLIGFAYKSWRPEDAASHFIETLLHIQKSLDNSVGYSDNFIVSIILDGENPWEHYRNYGIDFLEKLFGELESCDAINATSFRSFIRDNPESFLVHGDEIPPGSWIDGTFDIWFGHEEDFKAWREIYNARFLLNDNWIRSNMSSTAYNYIRIAEGSDWFWWYGDEHFTEDINEFDVLFRRNLLKFYSEIGRKPPRTLVEPIHSDKGKAVKVDEETHLLKPRGFSRPVIDGKLTDFYEWANGASFRQDHAFGAMHAAGVKVIERVHVVFDEERIFFRVDFTTTSRSSGGVYIITFKIDPGGEISFSIDFDSNFCKVERSDLELIDFAYEKILEIGFPIKSVKPYSHESGRDFQLDFHLEALTPGLIMERCPGFGKLRVVITGEDPSGIEWMA